MRIGLLAPPWLPVPPISYGGTELVIDGLARALVRAGHEVLLMTVGSSTCPVPRRSDRPEPVPQLGTTGPELAHVLWAYEVLRTEHVDVVHDHSVAGPVVAAGLPGSPPVVVTHHGRFDVNLRRVFGHVARSAAVVAISHSQRAEAPDVPVTAVIHHGVDLEEHSEGPGGEDLLFLGRMSPDKGLHRAIDVARRAGRRLVVVSKMWDPAEVAYFESTVRPLLGDDVVLMTGVGSAERVRLLRRSLALVNPIRWREPFGLVMAEALACGTPVLAFDEGAAPEIVEHGVTGFLCRDEAVMADAVGAVTHLSRASCRAAAVRRFGVDRMAQDYLALYSEVVARRSGSERSGGPAACQGLSVTT